jgi:hypothetical protein
MVSLDVDDPWTTCELRVISGEFIGGSRAIFAGSSRLWTTLCEAEEGD